VLWIKYEVVSTVTSKEVPTEAHQLEQGVSMALDAGTLEVCSGKVWNG